MCSTEQYIFVSYFNLSKIRKLILRYNFGNLFKFCFDWFEACIVPNKQGYYLFLLLQTIHFYRLNKWIPKYAIKKFFICLTFCLVCYRTYYSSTAVWRLFNLKETDSVFTISSVYLFPELIYLFKTILQLSNFVMIC